MQCNFSLIRDCSESLVKGEGVALLLVPIFLTRLPRGGMNILQRCRGWGRGIHFFYTHKKQNRTWQNAPFTQFPRRPRCPFRAIRPCCPEKLPAPWGVPIFDSYSEGGYQNFTVTPREGYAFFTGTFPEKGPPSPRYFY